MWPRIIAVARVSIQDDLKGRALYLYFGLFLLAWTSYQSDAEAGLLRACERAGWIAAFLALGAVQSDTRRRTLVAIMARPVARREYLAGKCLAILGCLVGFVALCFVCALMTDSLHMQQHAALEFLKHLVTGISWVVILLPLAALLTPWPCASLVIGLWVLAAVSSRFAEHDPMMAAADWLCHYASLAEINVFSPWMCLAALVDNLAYAAMVFIGCAWLYERQDVRLREA